MKNDTIKIINESLKFLEIKSDDLDNIKNLKIQTSGIILFIILANLFKDSDNIKNSVFEKFEKFEQIYADIVSSESNPNCSCRNRVIKYFSQNSDEIYKVLFELINDNTVFDTTYEKIGKNIKSQIYSYNKEVSSNSPIENDKLNYIAGQIWEIEDDPMEYFELINNLKQGKSIYKGISIVKTENRLKLYFY